MDTGINEDITFIKKDMIVPIQTCTVQSFLGAVVSRCKCISRETVDTEGFSDEGCKDAKVRLFEDKAKQTVEAKTTVLN